MTPEAPQHILETLSAIFVKPLVGRFRVKVYIYKSSRTFRGVFHEPGDSSSHRWVYRHGWSLGKTGVRIAFLEI